MTALNEGVVRNATPANMAVNKTLPDVQKALGDAFLPTDHVINQFNTIVVNTGRNLVLIDSGFGDNGPPTGNNLLSNMSAAGIDPKNIDTILVSHFHGDHISGIRAKGGAANYPNAEIMVPSGEWQFWNDASNQAKVIDNFKPGFANVKRVFDPVAKDVKQFEHGKELVAGITAVDSRGHSPGHTAFLVASGNGKLLVTSDTVNHQILIRNPDWSLWADMDAAMAVTARKRLLDMAASDKSRSRPTTCRSRRPASSRSAATATSSIRRTGSLCCSRGHAETSERPPQRGLLRFRRNVCFVPQTAVSNRGKNALAQRTARYRLENRSPCRSPLFSRTPYGRHFPPLCILSTMAHRQGRQDAPIVPGRAQARGWRSSRTRHVRASLARLPPDGPQTCHAQAIERQEARASAKECHAPLPFPLTPRSHRRGRTCRRMSRGSRARGRRLDISQGRRWSVHHSCRRGGPRQRLCARHL